MSLLLAFDDETALARRIVQANGWPLAIIERHRFPDGESRLRLPPTLPARTVLKATTAKNHKAGSGAATTSDRM